jgi:hypothetical protein
MVSRGLARVASAAVSTFFRLILVLALALSVSAEAQSSRKKKSSKGKKPAVTKPVPVKPEPEPEPEPKAEEPAASEPAPSSELASEPKPEATKPVADAPVEKPAAAGDGAVVLAIPRTSNAQDSAAKLQEELGRLLGQKTDVQLVDLGAIFPPPEPPSLSEADTLYDQGKELYDNLDPEAAAGKFMTAAEAYEKHPGALKPERLAKTFIFLGAAQLLNGDKEGAKNSFLRALAANPSMQPETGLFGSDVQTAFTDAQQEFNAQAKGTLVIDSKPAGARVTVRGEDVGVTPIKSVEVHPGRHPVVISLPGYVPYASYPQVAPSKSAELKPQLEPLPALASVLDAAAKASSERGFDSDKMPPEVNAIADKVGARYVVLAAVQQKKSDPAEAEVQVWDVRSKNRLRGVEIELQSKDENTPRDAAERIHGFLTGKALADSDSGSKSMPEVVKKPWFWAAVVGGAAVVTGGIIYATSDRSRDPLSPITGLPGLNF